MMSCPSGEGEGEGEAAVGDGTGGGGGGGGSSDEDEGRLVGGVMSSDRARMMLAKRGHATQSKSPPRRSPKKRSKVRFRDVFW